MPLKDVLTGYGGRIKKTYNRYDGYNRFGFCGEYFDEETGLIYLRNRYYNPNTGRFITEDPIKDGLNWYVYCHNDPLNYIDVSGLKEVALRKYIENLGGTVTPVKKRFWFIEYGLSHINVTLNGKSKKYTAADNTIRNDRSYIDDSVILEDFGLKQLTEKSTNKSVKENNMKLSAEEWLMICTVYGEAAGCSEASWQAVANVMMNRVGNREWSKYKSVTEIIKESGFDAFTSQNAPYKQAESYLNNRDGKNAHLEKCIEIVLGVYRGKLPDNTNGAVLYYSPKAQEELYGYKPAWNFNLLTEVNIKGGEKDDFKFYKYK